jgi:hypothetical protein
MICDTLHQALISHASKLPKFNACHVLSFLVYKPLITNYGNFLVLSNLVWYVFVSDHKLSAHILTNRLGVTLCVHNILTNQHMPHYTLPANRSE